MNKYHLNNLTTFAESMGMMGEPFTKVTELWNKARELAGLCWCCDFATIYPLIEELSLSDWKKTLLINWITNAAIETNEEYKKSTLTLL